MSDAFYKIRNGLKILNIGSPGAPSLAIGNDGTGLNVDANIFGSQLQFSLDGQNVGQWIFDSAGHVGLIVGSDVLQANLYVSGNGIVLNSLDGNAFTQGYIVNGSIVGYTTISGGGQADGTAGGSAIFYGPSHATKASKIEFLQAGVLTASATAGGSWTLGPAGNTGTNILHGLLVVDYGGQNTLSQLSSGDLYVGIPGANGSVLRLYGGQIQLNEAAIAAQTTGIFQNARSGSVSVSGGQTTPGINTSGGGIVFYGDQHASKANLIEIWQNNSLRSYVNSNGSLVLIDGNLMRPDNVGVAFAVGNGTNVSHGEFDWTSNGSVPTGSVTDSGLWTLGSAGGTLAHHINGLLNIFANSGSDVNILQLYAGTATGTIRQLFRNSSSTRSFEWDATFTAAAEALVLQSDAVTIMQWSRAGQYQAIFGGTQANPHYSFAAEPSSGIYRSGNHDLRMTINGADLMYWINTQIFINNGSAATPSFALVNSQNTGLFQFATGILGIAAGGIASVTISGSELGAPAIVGLNLLGTAATNNAIISGSTTDSLLLTGDPDAGGGHGGTLVTYARSHVSRPGYIDFYNDGQLDGFIVGGSGSRGNWTIGNNSGNLHTFQGSVQTAAANPASSGFLRLGNTEALRWRNAGNTANLGISVSASNELTFDGQLIRGNALSVSAGNVDIYNSVNNGRASLGGHGADPTVNGGGIIGYGGTHATKPTYLEFWTNGFAQGFIEITGTWTIGNAVNTPNVHQVIGSMQIGPGASSSHSFLQISNGFQDHVSLFLNQNHSGGGATWAMKTRGTSPTQLQFAFGPVSYNQDGDTGFSTAGYVDTNGVWSFGVSGGTQTHLLNGRLKILSPAGSPNKALWIAAPTTTGEARIHISNSNDSRSFEWSLDFTSGSELMNFQSDTSGIVVFTRSGLIQMQQDGSSANPVLSSFNEKDSGLYRFTGRDWRFAVAAADTFRFTQNYTQAIANMSLGTLLADPTQLSGGGSISGAILNINASQSGTGTAANLVIQGGGTGSQGANLYMQDGNSDSTYRGVHIQKVGNAFALYNYNETTASDQYQLMNFTLGASGGALTVGAVAGTKTHTFNGKISATLGIVGVTDGSNAASGSVGEYIEAVGTDAAFNPGSGVFSDLNQITLTPGDWDVTVMAGFYNSNPAGLTDVSVFIGTVAGNNQTGQSYGQNADLLDVTSGTLGAGATIVMKVPSYRMNVTSSTIVYLKAAINYSAGTPHTAGYRISARRIR